MAAPHPLVNTCSIYRPLGSALPIHVGVPCRLVPSIKLGRGSTSPVLPLSWTHFLDLVADYDIRDGCFRSQDQCAPIFNDGDEVRVTMGTETWVFVVVWVERRYPGEPENAYTRAYVTRDRVIGW